jgi:hypothetical protein
MNCTIVEKLLPLYVEGDLSERETAEVRAHLSSCDDCSGLSEEFIASQSRLHNFAVPEFGAEFYEQLRGAVLREINSGPAPRPYFFQTLRTLFTWRPAAAFALALLALCGALSLILYRSLAERDAPLLAIEENMGELNPAEIKEATAQDVKDASTREGGGVVRQQGIAARDNVKRQRAGAGAQANTRRAGSIPKSVDVEDASVAETMQGNGGTVEANSKQAIARMEIQTSDPNIRIIWLGRKPSE